MYPLENAFAYLFIYLFIKITDNEEGILFVIWMLIIWEELSMATIAISQCT